jgi:acid phosphatase type 7
MKKILLIILFILFSANSRLNCQTVKDIDNENMVITHGPYLQNLTAGGVTIIWTTNKPSVPGVYLTGGKFENKLIRNSHDGITDGGGTVHKVRLEGLEPGTAYKYRVNSVEIMKYQAYKIYYGDTLTSKLTGFSTIPVKSDRVNFTVINDVHENSGKLSSYLRSGKPADQDFYFFNGDMVDFLQEQGQLFRGFVDTATKYFASAKPFYYIRGNHETRGYQARSLKEYFDFSGGRFYYSFDMGPVHFVVLDCGEDKPDDNRYYYGLADYDDYRLEELQWLKSEVKSAAYRSAKYRVVMVHMPIIKEEKQGWGIRFLADNFGTLLQTGNVDLMISAHTHRNTYYEPAKSGFGYPVLVNSNNSFVEVSADQIGLKAAVKDVSGKVISEYKIK